MPGPENGRVQVNPDGTMDVTWKLREGILWHDGTPHTSADVSFTVAAINDPSYNPESTEGFDLIDSVAPLTRSRPSSSIARSMPPIRISSGAARFRSTFSPGRT